MNSYRFSSNSGAANIRIASSLAAKTAGKQHIAYKVAQFTTKIIAFGADFMPATSSKGVKIKVFFSEQFIKHFWALAAIESA